MVNTTMATLTNSTGFGEMVNTTMATLTNSTGFGAMVNTTMATLMNSSVLSDEANAAAVATAKKKSMATLIKVVYVIGIIGNAAAIVVLRVGKNKVRNRKHLLLLTTLAVNDLVALVGMLCSMVVSQHVPGVDRTQLYCATRVVMRTFGIGSVCIAVTMALERYLALTRPFLYQKQVTYKLIGWVLLISWLLAALLACAPLMGMGLYYDDSGPHPKCIRYREATEPLHFAYAVLYVVCGTLLCAVLVYCNLAVIRALYAITTPRGAAPLVRRVSRVSCRQRHTLPRGEPLMHHNAATAEEVAFSRLMAMLSVFFMFCWLPQMITSALYLALDEKKHAWLNPLALLSDILMLLNYVLDPILYVMQRRKPFATLCHSIATCFKRGHKSSEESMSMKTSCAPETLVISECSVPEARPLQPRSLTCPT